MDSTVIKSVVENVSIVQVEVDILALVRQAASKRILYLPHALRQMLRLDRMITKSEVRSVVEAGEVI